MEVSIPDITEGDNANLAISVQRIVNAFAPIYNACLIDEKEFIRLVYRFVAETAPAARAPDAISPFSPINLRGAQKPSLAVDPDEQK